MKHNLQFRGKGEWMTKDVCDALSLSLFPLL